MAAASPTPLGTGSHFTSLGRRTSARQALRSRPTSRLQPGRGESQPAVSSAQDAAAAAAFESAQPEAQQYDAMHDSSDDEIPVPMKLSALTKALLNDGSASDGASIAAHRQPSLPDQQPQPHPQPEPRMTRRRSYLTRGAPVTAEENPLPDSDFYGRDQRRHSRADSASAPSVRPSSPVRVRDSSPAPRKRIVRLSTTPGGGPASSAGLRRSLSGSNRRRPESRGPDDEPMQQAMSLELGEEAELNTPAQPLRRVQIPIDSSVQRQRSAGSSSGRASRMSGSAFRSDHEAPEEPRTELRPQSVLNQSSISRFGGSVRAREEANMQGSMRVKRLGKVAGSFLSGPARRGRRRESEEDRLARENGDLEMLEQQGHDEVQLEPEPVVPYRDVVSGSPISGRELRSGSRRPSHGDIRAASRMSLRKDDFETAQEELAKPRLDLPATKEQENIVHPPSAFNKRKASLSAHDREQEKKLLGSPSIIEIGSRAIPRAFSPERPILATISQNVQKTPHVVIPIQRPAPPPPPKMSVLDTATATAGAATAAQTKKKSVILKVNGRSYQRVDCIGRGGSAKVYRVTAENGKMFALKRVNIENADINTVRGYKGEINLLQKLSDVERVIKLYDYELNEEKHMLSLVSLSGLPVTVIDSLSNRY